MPGHFLMLTSREQEVLAISERDALLRFTGLSAEELAWVQLDHEPFPQVDLADWDGIIVCGSRFDASADESSKSPLQREVEGHLFDLYDRLLWEDFPFLGLCYGLGTLTKHMGGAVDHRYSEDISAPTLTLTEEGLRDPLLAGVPPQFRAYVGHHEAVRRLAPGMTLLVQGHESPYQMIRVGHNVYATQFHPELDLAGISLRIEIFSDSGYYPPEDRPLIERGVQGVDTTSAHLLLSNFTRLHSGRHLTVR